MSRAPLQAAAAGGLAIGLLASALTPATAGAQAIERHLAPAPAPSAPPVLAPAPLAAPADDQPIAGPLRQLVVLGADDPVLTDAVAPGVRLAGASPVPAARLEAALRPFLGRPLSRRLIGEAEAAVVQAYRRADRPFVSVIAPPQEVGEGQIGRAHV